MSASDGDESAVAEVRFDDAASFLEALRPAAPFWRSSPQSWLYRGHADVRWRLLPSINQTAILSRFAADVLVDDDRIYCKPTVAHVTSLLGAFADALGRSGRPVPVAENMRPHLRSGVYDSRQFQELAALGQHYGLPTQLLDWSRRASLAAYFAASDAKSVDRAAADLAVWALNSEIGGFYSGMKTTAVIDGRDAIVDFVEGARVGNPNLHAQDGAFTLTSYSGPPELTPTTPLITAPLEEVVRQLAPKRPDLGRPLMYRLTLPRHQAGELLRWLSYESVAGTSFFPGLEGVVRDVRDRAIWKPTAIG
jgi:hypothetical protein